MSPKKLPKLLPSSSLGQWPIALHFSFAVCAIRTTRRTMSPSCAVPRVGAILSATNLRYIHWHCRKIYRLSTLFLQTKTIMHIWIWVCLKMGYTPEWLSGLGPWWKRGFFKGIIFSGKPIRSTHGRHQCFRAAAAPLLGRLWPTYPTYSSPVLVWFHR